jgi:hypothetical protein
VKLSEFYATHGWCQGAYARDAAGNMTAIRAEEATSYCLLGAMHVVTGGKTAPLRDKLYPALRGRDFNDITSFNDDPATTKETVLALLAEIGE